MTDSTSSTSRTRRGRRWLREQYVEQRQQVLAQHEHECRAGRELGGLPRGVRARGTGERWQRMQCLRTLDTAGELQTPDHVGRRVTRDTKRRRDLHRHIAAPRQAGV